MAAGVMAAYFALVLAVFPDTYQDTEIGSPQPSLQVTLSAQQIKLGQSFEMSLVATNLGEEADMQTVTVGFPQNQNLDNVKIISYDFLQSPRLYLQDKEVGSAYSGGDTLVQSQYPFIEAYSRPSKPDHAYTMTIQITPIELGPYHIYTKTVAMPHITELAHYPIQGILDQQNEFVQEHVVEVVP